MGLERCSSRAYAASVKRLESIQTLRALAAVFVVVFHAMGYARQSGWHVGIPIGAFGVDVFFVVSGFVMVLTTQRSTAPGKFLADRLTRIAPLYWFVTTARIFVALAVPALGALRLDPLQVFTSYTFLPWHDSEGLLVPVLPVGWTLTYEMTFYCAFAALGLRAERLALLFGGMVLFGLAVPLPLIAAWITDPMLLEFVAGCAIGLGYTGQRWWLVAAVACIALALPDSRALYWGLPAAILVGGGVALERWWPHTILSRLGDSSYALYLIHLFALRAVLALAAKTFETASPVIAVATAVLASIAVGVAAHLFLERPLTTAVRRYRKYAPIDL